MTDDERTYWDGHLARLDKQLERVLNRIDSLERAFTPVMAQSTERIIREIRMNAR